MSTEQSAAQIRFRSNQLVERATQAFNTGAYKEAIDLCTEAVQLDPIHMAAYVWRASAASMLGDNVRVIADCTAALNTRDPLCQPGSLVVELTRRTRIIRAYAHLGRGDLGSTIQDCTSAINLDATYAEPFVTRGIAYAKLGQRDRARADLDMAKKLGADSVEFHAGLGYLHFQNGEYADSYRECMTAIEGGTTSVDPYLTLSNIYLKYEKLEEALVECGRAFEVNPRSADAHCNRGAVYTKMGKFDEALSDYTSAIEFSAVPPIFFLRQRATLFMLFGKPDEAIADCNEMIAIAPGYAEGYVTRAQLYLAQHKFGPAVEDLETATKINPESAPVYLLRALSRNQLNDFDNGLNDSITALSLGANFTMSLLAKAAAQLGLNRFDKALNDATTSLNDEPRADGYHLRGIIYLKMNKIKEAIQDFDLSIAVSRNPAITENAHLMRALAFTRAAQYEEALVDIGEALRLNPSSVSALSYRIQIYLVMNKLDLALYDYDSIIEILPKSPDWRYRRATLHFAMRQYRLAVDDATQAIDMNPNCVEAYYYRAVAYNALSQIEPALEDLDVCVTLKPSEQVHLTRASIFAKTKNLEKMLEEYDRALEQNPISSTVYYHKSCTLLQMERYEDALLTVEKAISFQPNNGLYIASRGHICLLLEQYNPAVEQLTLAIERSPKLACAFMWRAAAFEKLGRVEECEADLQMAASLGLVPQAKSGQASQQSL